MKQIIFLLLLVVIYAGCGGNNNQGSKKTSGQIISNSWEGEDKLDAKNEWKTLRPPVIITTDDSTDIVALFIGEFAPKISSVDEGVGTGDEEDIWVVYSGVPIELRIKVDDIIASPSSSMITNSFVTPGNFETSSFLASLRNLQSGTHTITAEWRSIDSGAVVRNRTITVWESVNKP